MRRIDNSNGAISSKLIVIIAAILVVGAGIGAIMLTGPQDGNNDNPTDIQYTGAIIPSNLISESEEGAEYVFTGRPSNQPSSTLQEFDLQSTQSFDGITGGIFTISGSGNDHMLKSVVSSDVRTPSSDEVPAKVSQTYDNFQVEMIAVSVVYAGYTFGVGTTGTNDYIWIAPHRSYPAFFSHVSAKGMAMDQKTLAKLSTEFSSSIFGTIELARVTEVAAKFGFSFNGLSDHFLVINELGYIDASHVNGDVIDTLVPSDLDRLAALYSTSGTDWVRNIIDNIGEGSAFVTESDSTMGSTKLWILLFPLDMATAFKGICDLTTSQSDYSLFASKAGHAISSFLPQATETGFQVNVGVVIDVSSGSYSKTSVLDLWNKMGKSGPTQVESVSVRGYGIVVDAQTMASSLDGALGLSGSASGLTSISTFKNPAFVFLLDENFAAMFGEDDVPFWHYGAICIIPNYNHVESAFRYLEIDGTVYDTSIYFGSSSPLLRIPLVISDSYRDVVNGLQQVSIKDLRADNLVYHDIGGIGGAYVEFDSQPVGTSLGTLLSLVGLLPFISIQCLPIDLGMYLAIQKDGGLLYYVPVLYLSAGKGATYFGGNIVDVRGMYLDFSPSSSSYHQLQAEVDVKDNTSKILPTGVVFAFAMDKMNAGLSDAKAYGPTNVTQKEFDVHYTFDQSLLNSGPVAVQLYWEDSSGWLGPTWNYYGTDPTPGDGRFHVDASKMDGDQIYGWLIRVKNVNFMSDNPPPGLWADPESTTRVNYLPPLSVPFSYLQAPAPGTSVTLNWQMSTDPSFYYYAIFMGDAPNMIPSTANYIGYVNDRGQTSAVINGLAPETQYYFIIGVYDLDGFYSNSNVNYTRTFASHDSGSSTGTATLVTSGMAWTEDTTFVLDPSDLFKIYLDAGETLTVDMIGNTLGGADLYVYDPDVNQIGYSANIGVTEHVQVTALVSGYYYVFVYSPLQGTDWYTLWFYVK